MEDKSILNLKAIICVAPWGIWITKNVIPFKGKSLSPLEFFYNIKFVYNEIKVSPKSNPMRQLRTFEIDKSNPYNCFNDASNGNHGGRGAGVSLFLSNSHYCVLKLGLGRGTNNWSKIRALIALIRISIEKGLDFLQVFSDSELTIDWIQGNAKMHNILLHQILYQIKPLIANFSKIYFTHIYRVCNMLAYKLSK
jgi:ribonuclease HI